MFWDLPSIDYDCEDASWHHIYSDRLHTNWPSALMGCYDQNISTHRYSSYAAGRYNQLEDSYKLLAENGQEFRKSSVSWQQSHRRDWESYPVKYAAIASWAPSLAFPGRVSPVSCLDGRSASEGGSWSDGSTWTPGQSPDRNALESDIVPSPDIYGNICHALHRGWAQSFGRDGQSPSLPEASLQKCIQSGSGITLQDVQQYPDACQEDQFVHRSHRNNQSQCDFLKPGEALSEDDDKAGCPDPTTPSPGHAPMSLPAGGENFTIKDESMSDVESESCSDYSPVRRTNTSGPRSLRKRKPSRPTRKHANKISSRSKPQTGTSSITKRSAEVSLIKSEWPLRSEKISCTMCFHCKETLPTKAALHKHITTAHTRPFTCTFQMYGCPATFGSKNEWKRHVSSQHLRLGIWRCDSGACLPRHNDLGGVDDAEASYNEFNRKDLFTQHLRRMHAPPRSSSHHDHDAFVASLETASKRCLRDIRSPPPSSTCGYCPIESRGEEMIFEGAGSWEARMEHVGRHLESGHGERQEWKEDVLLRRWMVQEELVEEREDGTLLLVGLPVGERKNDKTAKK